MPARWQELPRSAAPIAKIGSKGPPDHAARTLPQPNLLGAPSGGSPSYRFTDARRLSPGPSMIIRSTQTPTDSMNRKMTSEHSSRARGKLKIGDDWNAITIIALSQTSPLKAIAELVENSIDAKARTVTITRGREHRRHFLSIRDDGEGVPRDNAGRPDFRYVATHICDSVKRRLKADGTSGLQGEFGIGCTPPGQCTWQDLVMLKWDVPQQWHNGGTYVMNQRTWALLATMSDAIGRPLFSPSPIQDQPGFMLNGSPVIIATQMPECLPGNTPILYANLRQLYTLVQRSGTTMMPDPYSAQWCTLFRFEARVGGALTCPSAGRLLRVR